MNRGFISNNEVLKNAINYTFELESVLLRIHLMQALEDEFFRMLGKDLSGQGNSICKAQRHERLSFHSKEPTFLEQEMGS